jgi:hypothetical protein
MSKTKDYFIDIENEKPLTFWQRVKKEISQFFIFAISMMILAVFFQYAFNYSVAEYFQLRPLTYSQSTVFCLFFRVISSIWCIFRD